MSTTMRAVLSFGIMALLLFLVGYYQSWSVMLVLINLSLISAVMALGTNIQWGYAGIFNVGIMGFAALGGVAAVLASQPPVAEAWSAGGSGILVSGILLAGFVAGGIFLYRGMRPGTARNAAMTVLVVAGYFIVRYFYDPAVNAIEAVDPAKTGYLGGLGLPILFSWAVGGLFAAGAAWLIGKIALGLRADYLAIATLGISEIVIFLLKNEDWLTRGVKNVNGLKRPVPYEVDLQTREWFIEWVRWFNAGKLEGMSATGQDAALRQMVIEASGIFVKLSYTFLFASVMLVILMLCVLALNSPWGRMVRAIRDNEVAAGAMGKNVTKRHLQIFVLGSAVVGIAGAMLTTLDGQFTPGTYIPLRHTFLIWVMVVVGGSGNNLGSVLGGFLIWFMWIEAEPAAVWLMETITAGMDAQSPVRLHLLESAQHMRLFVMGIILLAVLRFSPGGILPEQVKHTGDRS